MARRRRIAQFKVKRLLYSPPSQKTGKHGAKRRALTGLRHLPVQALRCALRPTLRLLLFKAGFGSNSDWEAWEAISRHEGDLYDSSVLILHRIHDLETSHLYPR